MPRCVSIRRKKRNICIGDLRDQVTIETRSITIPTSGSVTFGESFATQSTVWAMIETKSGIQQFDGVNTIATASHKIYIRYIGDITFENWLVHNGVRYDILDVENLEERNEFYLLRCSKMGDSSIPSNFSR